MEGLVAPTFDTGALAQRIVAQLRTWARQAATFGSAGSMVLAAAVGIAAFAFALASVPVDTLQASPPPARAASPAPTGHGPLTNISVPVPAADDTELLAPIGVAPGPAVETALDYDVVFFWPATPQTVAEPVAIRDGPAPYAKVIRSARPGERLRINGRTDEAPNGPWLRVRLEDGRDGYFAARTMDVGAFRRKRAEEPAPGTAGADGATAGGAPLTINVPPPPDDFGPPAF